MLARGPPVFPDARERSSPRRWRSSACSSSPPFRRGRTSRSCPVRRCSDGTHVVTWTIGNSEADKTMHVDTAIAVSAWTRSTSSVTPLRAGERHDDGDHDGSDRIDRQRHVEGGRDLDRQLHAGDPRPSRSSRTATRRPPRRRHRPPRRPDTTTTTVPVSTTTTTVPEPPPRRRCRKPRRPRRPDHHHDDGRTTTTTTVPTTTTTTVADHHHDHGADHHDDRSNDHHDGPRHHDHDHRTGDDHHDRRDDHHHDRVDDHDDRLGRRRRAHRS